MLLIGIGGGQRACWLPRLWTARNAYLRCRCVEILLRATLKFQRRKEQICSQFVVVVNLIFVLGLTIRSLHRISVRRLQVIVKTVVRQLLVMIRVLNTFTEIERPVPMYGTNPRTRSTGNYRCRLRLDTVRLSVLDVILQPHHGTATFVAKVGIVQLDLLVQHHGAPVLVSMSLGACSLAATKFRH
uniref:(northern house mosquito) hypothetical protein n=1 Tax=Culex pipiens TaxID=7175 RepID=A0A8D8LGB3_CULPI